MMQGCGSKAITVNERNSNVYFNKYDVTTMKQTYKRGLPHLVWKPRRKIPGGIPAV